MRLLILAYVFADCKKMFLSCNDEKCTVHTCQRCPDGYSVKNTEIGKLCFKFYEEQLNWAQAW